MKLVLECKDHQAVPEDSVIRSIENLEINKMYDDADKLCEKYLDESAEPALLGKE